MWGAGLGVVDLKGVKEWNAELMIGWARESTIGIFSATQTSKPWIAAVVSGDL